jgi:FtsP/CotA-like multicopper oxidase with cupredoxin domain
MAEGKDGLARAVVRTAAGDLGSVSRSPSELQERVLTVADLRPATAVALPPATVDRKSDVRLGGDMARYTWTLNGRTFNDRVPLVVREGERLRLGFDNRTMMFHPMHLHGHTFAVVGPDGRPGVRKDTLVVKPMERLEIDIQADNPGQWMLHCHNAYHAEAGMATTLSYEQ